MAGVDVMVKAIPIMLMAVFSVAVATSARAETEIRAMFEQPVDAVWSAAQAVLERASWPVRTVDQERGVIRTGWKSEEVRPKRWDTALRERDQRHRLSLQMRAEEGRTLVEASLRTQQRPVGRYGAAWQESDGEEARLLRLLDAIEAEMGDGAPSAAPAGASS